MNDLDNLKKKEKLLHFLLEILNKEPKERKKNIK